MCVANKTEMKIIESRWAAINVPQIENVQTETEAINCSMWPVLDLILIA